jgi:hypothetical protein
MGCTPAKKNEKSGINDKNEKKGKSTFISNFNFSTRFR